MENLLQQGKAKALFRGIDALRFYGGDTRERGSDGDISDVECRDAMYGDKNAYRTLNALLFEDIESEQERIWREGNVLNPEFIKRIDETVQIYTDIFTLMKEGKTDFDYTVVGKRVERASSIPFYRKGFTQSFFSCSKGRYDPSFAKKKGIVLIRMNVRENVPFIDYEKTLSIGEYKNCDEREILLPPFVKIEMKETETSFNVGKTRGIKDLDGKGPLKKYEMTAIEFPDYRKDILDSKETLWRQIIEEKESASYLLEMMNKKDKGQDYSMYVNWKIKLHKYLKICFSNIWYGGQ